MSTGFTTLGDRMKVYESMQGSGRLIPMLPLIVRLDGKAFHSFTRGLARPFDDGLHDLMVDATKFLVDETNANIGYTQSDEISLVLYHSVSTDVYFDRRIDKINSVLAAKCSVRFNSMLPKYLPNKLASQPVFDCRCFAVPTRQEAVNYLVWREQDATRNSIQMAGQAAFNYEQLLHKSCDEIQEMLFKERGINWNEYPVWCKRGTYVQRHKVFHKFTSAEIELMPPKHAARANPQLLFSRVHTEIVNMPILTQLINAEDTVFSGDAPVTCAEFEKQQTAVATAAVESQGGRKHEPTTTDG